MRARKQLWPDSTARLIQTVDSVLRKGAMISAEPNIAERISANTIVLRDMLRTFQQEPLATFGQHSQLAI